MGIQTPKIRRKNGTQAQKTALLDNRSQLQSLLCDLTLVAHMQIKELAPGMGQAADFRDAIHKPGFVTAEVVANQ